MRRCAYKQKSISIIVMIVFMLSLFFGQVPTALAKTYQTPIADPANDTVAINVMIGGVTLPYTWGDVTGTAGYKFAGQAITGTYLTAGDSCEGIKFSDLLSNIESTLGITLSADYLLKGVSSDGYANPSFTVAEARDYDSNHYLLAHKVNGISESCIGYNSSDPSKTYPASYLRIARNRPNQDGFGNTAYMRLISSLQISKSDGSSVALANVNLAQNNGTGLGSLTPATTGLVIGGAGISKGAGLKNSFVYYNQGQVDYSKANKNVNGLGLGNAWTSEPVRYSSYDNHGTPEYVYRLSEGINLKTALTALGADVSSAAVDIAATASDYNAVVGDAFGYAAPRKYIAPDSTAGAAVDPILIFYDNKVETSAPGAGTTVPTETAAISDTNPLFAFGQKQADEQTNCKFVKKTVKIRAGIDTPAFTITQDHATKSISLSDIALIGIYQTSYFWDNGGTAVTQSVTGVPLSTLLSRLQITVPVDKGLVITVDNGSGSVASTRTISYSEISQCFVAYDAFENSQRIKDCNTPLRIYCPGQNQDAVLIQNVVSASVEEVGTGTEGKDPGGDISNSVFYLAVKDASGQTKTYYYTKAELESYEKQEAYTYDDHGVIKTVTCKGALLQEMLDDLNGVTLADSMVVQYAEEDGYHADAGTAVANSNYKDTIASLTQETLDGSGNTKKAMRSMVTYAIHEEYAVPDENNVNDPAGEFKDADNHSGYLRVYRDTGGANSAVMKYIMGAVVSTDGTLLSGSKGCVISSVSDKNPTVKVRNDITLKGLLPDMQYAVKAPAVTNASLTVGQTNPVLITVGSGAPAEQVITFTYTEDTYFYVANTINHTTTNYTYTDFIGMHKQVPDPSSNTPPYGYSRPMYYRYNGVWLSDLISGLSGDYIVNLVAKDGSKTDITDHIAQYFAAYNRTQSKSSTNIPEGKRVTITYDDTKIIIPGSGENITGSSATDYSSAGKDVDVLLAAAEGLEIKSSTAPTHDPRHSSYPADSAYGKAEYLYDTLTIDGSGMTQGEKIYSVKEIENLYGNSQYGCDLTYSITGSEGAYSSSTLSGVRLYEMLVQAGIDASLPDSTSITFIAKDGYKSIRTLGDVRNTAQYHYYNEAGADQASNLPVLLSFGINGYPLVGPIGFQSWFDPNIEGLIENHANEGGPLKLTFGQTAPGSNNAQYNSKLLTKIIVGNDVKSTQHNRVPYSQYGDEQLTIRMINAANAELISSQSYTVNQIEAMVNSDNTALLHHYYPTTGANYYEGINLWYLLAEQFGLTGTEGEVSFTDAEGHESNRLNLEYLRNPSQDYSAYYTSKDGKQISWVKPVLAYALNGVPLQEQGPLRAALPQHVSYLPQGLDQVCTSINVYIYQDDCTHSTAPYSQWKDNKIAFSGDGLQVNKELSVEDLEKCLELIETGSYTVGSESADYRGIKLYDLLSSNKLGLKMETDRIEVTNQNGTVSTFSPDELQNSQSKVMLAYGKNGKPLVPAVQDSGYDADAANSGGPIFLVVNGDAGRCLAQVTEVKVIAKATESWKHDRSAPYNTYLDTNFLRICGSGMGAAQVYSLRELEAMDNDIVREYLVASEIRGYYEGLKLKELLQTGGVAEQPAKITVCSPDASGAVFAKQLTVDDVWDGITSTSQSGAVKPVVLAYAKDGYPLVNSLDPEAGYVSAVDNSYGPLRLVVENSKPLCVKYVAGIIVGDGTPVAYTVNYLDKSSGEAIRIPKISVGTDAESIAAAAETIAISGYAFNSADQEQLVLNVNDKPGNVLNLYYEQQAEPTYKLIDVGLVISGSGVPNLVYYTKDQLKQMANGSYPQLNTETRSYSALARGGIKTLIRAKGIDLGDMLQEAEVKDKQCLIMTISSDSNRVDLTYNGETGKFSPGRYYFADLLPGDNGSSGPVDPILAFYRAQSNEEDTNPHLPTEAELQAVDKYPLPTLTVGQTEKTEFNNQCNNKYVQQLIVGDKYADVFTISGNGLKKDLSYTVPELMLKGMEKKTIRDSICKGISLARLLGEIKNLDEADRCSFVTEKSGGITLYDADGKLEHVTELIIGSKGEDSIKLSDLKNPDNEYFIAYNIEEAFEIIPAEEELIPRPIYLVEKEKLEQETAATLALPNKSYVNMSLYTKTVLDAAGKEKLVLVEAGRKAVQEAAGGSILLFTANEVSSGVTLEVSREVLALMQAKDLYLQINIAQGTYLIKAADIIFSDLVKEFGTESFVLQIKLSEASAEQCQKIAASLSTGYALQSVPLCTEIICVGEKRQSKISDFPSYLFRDLLVSEKLVPVQCSVLCWDDGSNVPRVVPAVIIERNGKTYVRAFSRSNSVYAVVSGQKTFADMQQHAARTDVELLASKLILSGKSSQEFDPNGDVTRAEMAAMLVKALGLKQASGQQTAFSDVQGNEWFAGSIATAVRLKMINGMPDGTFQPQKNVNQQEAMVMIANALKIAGVKTELSKTEMDALVARFNDGKEIADWACLSTAVAVKTGVIKGEGRFDAEHKLSRAESASLIASLLRACHFIDERGSLSTVTAASNPAVQTAIGSTREDEKGILVVEGSALSKKALYSLDELKAMSDIAVSDVYFSRGKAKENWQAEQHDTFTGVSLYKLLLDKIGLTREPSVIRVVAADGYSKIYTLEEATGLYMDETDPKAKLEMIIAWARNGEELSNDSDQPFRIVFGQKYEGDYNRQNWVNYVKRIVVY